jgi:hypothetical protein
LRRSDGGRLDKEHVLAFVRRFLETWSISNVGDPSADLDVELFACGGDDVSNWTTVQSPWGRWLGLVRDIAAAAEKELGAQAAQTMVIGNQVVDGAAYRNGRPDVNGFMPKERAAIVDLLKTLSLPVVPEMSELPPSTAAISRFRLPTAAPMSMTQAGPLAVPRALCGKRGNAATRWRRITRKVARAGTWKDVLSTLDFVDVRQTGGQLICWDRSSVYEENYWLCYTVGHNFWMDCVEAAGSRDGGTQRAIALVEEGLDWFWICLGLLAEQELWFPSELLFPRNPEQVPKDATVRQILRGIMKWWEPLCELNERTYDILRRKWKWQMAIRQMCEGMPVDQYSRLSDRQITPQAAGEIIRKWLDGPET